METVKNIASAVITIGGLGAFIDFVIGSAGQAKAKDFMLKWWVRFDDVRWNNFGREEGLFAGRLIERCFGRRIWSSRRITSTIFTLGLLLLIAFSIGLLATFNVACLQHARSGIRANSMLPGMMNTPMVHALEVVAAYGGSAAEMVRRRDEQCPMGRMGDAWDVAYAALFLASDEAKYITGTELLVDGGLTVNCI
jgi:hypothetical protein